MAVNVSMKSPQGRSFGAAALSAPRMLMSWEDWLTLGAALITFISVAVSIQQANWVNDGMPPVVITTMAALVIGMFAARTRVPQVVSHPVAAVLGIIIVVLVVQSYADGATVLDRIADFRVRMNDWWDVVRAGDISNDRLPFVTLVHGVTFLSTYLAAYAIYRWHNPWIAILPGGVVLLANIGLQSGQPTGAFIFFLFGGILLIARLHLQKNQSRWKRQGIEYPEFISVSAGQLTLFLAVALLFAAWLIPAGNQANSVERVYDAVASPFTGNSSAFGRLFHNVDSRKGGRLHTFGNFLAIQGDVKLGRKQLYEVKSGEPGLLRGASYDEYTGTGWKIGPRESQKIAGGTLAASSEAADYEARQPTILEVTVLDGDNSVLSIGTPLGTNVEALAQSPEGFQGDIEQLFVRRGLNTGDTYNSIGSESVATAEQLRAAGTNYPAWVKERYLGLPRSLPQRVRAETGRVAGAAPTDYDRAKAIEEYLRTFPYDLSVEAAPAGTDVVDFLLFDLKKGYFDYQATAMAVMLRTLGIPSRVAVGYVLDPNEVLEGRYIVRKDDAYTWVEVYFPTYGWVVFNPTADRPEGGAGGGILGTGASADDILNDASLDNLFGLDGLSGGVTPATTALTEPPVVKSQPPWTLIWALAGAAAFIAIVTASGRLAWNRGFTGLTGPVRLWAQTQRVASWVHLGVRTAETPREWSRRVGPQVERKDEAADLAMVFEESRYGRPDLQRLDPAQAEGAYKRLRNSLLARLVRVPARLKRKK